MNRHAHILGLMSLAMASFGLAIGSELRTTLIMAGLLALASAATIVHQKGLLSRPVTASATTTARKDSLVTTKRLLMLMLAIGIVVYAGGAGTFSSFSAETSNNGSSVASGTLELSDTTKNNAGTTGSACLSTVAPSKDNYRIDCDTPLTLTNQAPGAFPGGVATITLQNVGTIDGSQLTMYAPYANAKLASQITNGSTISSLSITALEGNVLSGDTIEVDYAGQSQQMVASADAHPTSPTISVATPASQSCTTINLNTSVTCGSTAALRAGMTVTGAGIAANTTISAVTSGTQLVLSQNATANGSGVTLSFAVNATQLIGTGARVYDVSSNASAAQTDCFDQITQYANQPNFNGTDVADGISSHWDTTNALCKTLLFFVQEQSQPTAPQAATTTNASTSVTVANSAFLSPGMSVTGANIAANTVIASITNSTTIVLSQAASAGGATTLTFTANYCWAGQGSFGSTGATNPATQAATTTSASTTVTVVNSALLSTGMKVAGTGIATGSIIVAIPDTTHIVLSAPATASGGPTLTFTTAFNMCYAPIGANFPGSGTTNVTGSTSLLTFATGLKGNIRSGDTITISEPKKMVVTCKATQDAYIGATSVTVDNSANKCTSTASTWVTGTGENFDGTSASAPAVAATIVDSTANNLLNSDTTDTITNFDTTHSFSNKIELPALTGNGIQAPSGSGFSTTELAKQGATGDTRVFYVGIFFPAGSGTAQNATQGLKSTFGLSWKLQQ